MVGVFPTLVSRFVDIAVIIPVELIILVKPFEESATYAFPEASIENSVGLLSCACVARPPLPAEGETPA
jgi:hypothetical protein